MNTDFRIDICLARHWKFRKLKRLIGPAAMEHLVVFWGTVAEQVPNGALNGWSTEDIEACAEWSGEPGVFFRALVDSGFLDQTETGYYPHDWHEHQPWVVKAPERSEAARKAGKASAASRSASANRQRPVERPVERPVNETFNGLATDWQPLNGLSTPSPLPSPLPIKPISSSSSTAVVNKPQGDKPKLQTADDDDGGKAEKLTLVEFRQLYQECIGVIMPGGLNHDAQVMCGRFPRDRLREAFLLTAEKGGKSLSYVKTILEGEKKKAANNDWSELWEEANGTSVRATGA